MTGRNFKNPKQVAAEFNKVDELGLNETEVDAGKVHLTEAIDELQAAINEIAVLATRIEKYPAMDPPDPLHEVRMFIDGGAKRLLARLKMCELVEAEEFAEQQLSSVRDRIRQYQEQSRV